MIRSIFFDLDGTLLSIDMDDFIKRYYTGINILRAKLNIEEKTYLKAFNNGVKAMMLNDGTQTNEESFWDTFTLFTEVEKEDVERYFLEYYLNEFQEIGKNVVTYDGLKECLVGLREKGYRIILATNPLFPEIATFSRIRWAGLDSDNFEYISTYENSRYSKPNPLYYKELLSKLDINPNEVLMVGNDMDDDSPIIEFGAELFIVTNNLINKNNQNLPKLHGKMEDLIKYLNSLEKLK